jgi:hypothetical protein
MSTGGTVVEPLGNRTHVAIFGDGKVTIKAGQPGQVLARSEDGVQTAPLGPDTLTVLSPPDPPRLSQAEYAARPTTRATGERSIAVGGSYAGVISTGDNAQGPADTVRPQAVHGLVVEVPANVAVSVQTATELTVDPAIQANITDERR